jgi:hypothetical protein
MKIFPLPEPILLTLIPTIAGSIDAYLGSIARQVCVRRSSNCNNTATESSPDRFWDGGNYQQSVRLVTTSQYQYVSTIAHRLAAKFSLTPLEICQQLQLSRPNPIVNAANLEIYCWYNDAGYLYFQLTPETIAKWLNYIHDLPLDLDLAEDRSPTSVAIATYAHARCCSVLRLALADQLVTLTDNWQIIAPNWSMVAPSCLDNRHPTALKSIFEHSVESRLIHALMAVLDAIYTHNWTYSSPQSAHKTGGDRSNSSHKIRPPNWSKLAIDLAQSWLEFHRHCRIFGDVKSQNPHLAIARCGLTAIARRYLQVLLENYLGTIALLEL